LGDRVVLQLQCGNQGLLRLQQQYAADAGPWQVCWPQEAELHFDPQSGRRLP
jgi:hypothetical protein